MVSTWQAVRAVAAEAVADEQRNAAVVTAERAKESELAAQEERDAAVAARKDLRPRAVCLRDESRSGCVGRWTTSTACRNCWKTRVPNLAKQTSEASNGITGTSNCEGKRKRSVTDIPATGTRKTLASELSPDGKQLAVQYSDDDRILVVIHETTTSRELVTIDLWPAGDTPRQSSMYFSPDGGWLAVAKTQTELFGIWNTQSGEKKDEFEALGPVWRIDLSHGGGRVAFVHGPQTGQDPENSNRGGLRSSRCGYERASLLARV